MRIWRIFSAKKSYLRPVWAEAKLGELLKGIDKRESYTDFQHRKSVLPPDITHKQSFYAQKLGELLKANPPGFQRRNSGEINQNPLPSGITRKQSFYAQKLAEIDENLMRADLTVLERGEHLLRPKEIALSF